MTRSIALRVIVSPSTKLRAVRLSNGGVER